MCVYVYMCICFGLLPVNNAWDPHHSVSTHNQHSHFSLYAYIYMYILPHLPLLRPRVWQVVSLGARGGVWGGLGGLGRRAGRLRGSPGGPGGAPGGLVLSRPGPGEVVTKKLSQKQLSCHKTKLSPKNSLEKWRRPVTTHMTNSSNNNKYEDKQIAKQTNLPDRQTRIC